MTIIMGGPTQWQLSATIPSVPLGTWMSPGYLFCKNLGVALVVAPVCSEVCRTWYCRNDAIAQANLCSGAAGWFVPSPSQLVIALNCGCGQYWDVVSGSFVDSYWSNTEYSDGEGCLVSKFYGPEFNHKAYGYFVRAFRCITY